MSAHDDLDTFDSRRVRVVRDADERAWRLREIVAASADAPPRATALLANDGTVLRRITAYPADWHERPAEELLALIHAAAKFEGLRPARFVAADQTPAEDEAGPPRG